MSYFKSFFRRNKPKEEVTYLKPKDIHIEDNHIDIPSIEIKNYKAERKTLLIMDDYPGMISLLRDDLSEVQGDYESKYNILEATGNFAAFSVIHFLNKSIIPIDLALIDITLGGIVVKQGAITEYDGVDVALMLLKRYPRCKIRFVTGHTINRKNPEIYKFIKKYEDATGLYIDEIIVPKNSNRKESIATFLQEVM